MTGPCCSLLPHSPSAPPITSPESHPPTPRLPSSVIPPRFPHKVGLCEAATTELKWPLTETTREEPFLYLESRFQRAALPTRGRAPLIQTTGEDKHRASFHLRFNSEKLGGGGDPGPETVCPAPPTTGAGQKRETLRGPAARKGKRPGEARWISPR